MRRGLEFTSRSRRVTTLIALGGSLLGMAFAPKAAASANSDCPPLTVKSGGLCIENPHRYPIIPTIRPELYEGLRSYPENLHCDTVFASPDCGPNVSAVSLTPGMLALSNEIYVASDDCYRYNRVTEDCVL